MRRMQGGPQGKGRVRREGKEEGKVKKKRKNHQAIFVFLERGWRRRHSMTRVRPSAPLVYTSKVSSRRRLSRGACIFELDGWMELAKVAALGTLDSDVGVKARNDNRQTDDENRARES